MNDGKDCNTKCMCMYVVKVHFFFNFNFSKCILTLFDNNTSSIMVYAMNNVHLMWVNKKLSYYNTK